ncbi:MAG TPA: hypothetical protein VKS20_02395 [Candidatus Acidoferrales bacterium]|nr:hypothetical protein [Candidatus Acidoferrales bacterium]
MAREITTGTILIKDYTFLPKELHLEAEPFISGWGLVKNFDGYRLDRDIRKAGWHFFFLAGQIKMTVFGIDRQKMVRRAIVRILASPRSEGFNSLEITRMASKRFLGVPYMRVGAQSRHIQEGLFLFSAEGSRKLGETNFTVARGQSTEPTSPKELASEGTSWQSGTATTASL